MQLFGRAPPGEHRESPDSDDCAQLRSADYLRCIVQGGPDCSITLDERAQIVSVIRARESKGKPLRFGSEVIGSSKTVRLFAASSGKTCTMDSVSYSLALRFWRTVSFVRFPPTCVRSSRG